MKHISRRYLPEGFDESPLSLPPFLFRPFSQPRFLSYSIVSIAGNLPWNYRDRYIQGVAKQAWLLVKSFNLQRLEI